VSLVIEQMDVETAFLNGKVISDIFVNQPKGYEDGTNMVCKLERSLYGLREILRTCYEFLNKFLINLGFKRSNIDYCLYTFKKGTDIVYLLVYVDDLLICTMSKEKIQDIKKLLADEFKMKNLGEIKEYLGINVEYDYYKKKKKMIWS
jgi:hypothetical protein